MEEITIKEVVTKKSLRDFIYLPSKIHMNEPNWLPPIYADEWLLFNKKKNRSYQYTEAVFYLAYRGKKPVGRIMGLINKRYNTIKNEKHGRFCFMECFNDQEVFKALLTKVEGWARENGMTKIVGPLGFSDKDPQGFQIEGFETPQIFTSATNSPYLPRMIEMEGYVKEVDLVNYNIEMPETLPPVYTRIYDRLVKSDAFKVIEFEKKKDLKTYILPTLELMNETFADIYGFVPLNDKEKKEFASRYMSIIDPEYVKLIETDGKLIGFIVGMPDLSPGIRAAKGKIFPFGIFKILKEMKKSRKLMLMLGGVTKQYRGQGIEILMGTHILKTGLKNKMNIIDSHLILESNLRMRAECERLDGKIVKRFRIYQKDLKM